MVQALCALSDTTDDEIEFQQLQSELLQQPESIDATLSVGEITDGCDAWLNPLHRIGQTIDDYELTHLLGHGANGCVYKARHKKLDRVFAIKLLAPHGHNRIDSVRRFLDEMKAVGRLDHPNIVQATDAGEFQGQHYMVMEYVEGIDLSALVRKLGPLPVADAAEIIRRAAAGLHFAHQSGMVHRDVKPSNLLFDFEGDVKVLDLGLVATASDPNTADLDSSGIICRGTADYMSPELWSDYRQVDRRADIYSLGCTLFKLLTGFAPFAQLSSGISSKMQAHEFAPFPSARKHNPEVPLGLDRLIRQMTNKNAADRLPTMNDVAQKLAPYAQQSDLRRLGSIYRAGQRLVVNDRQRPVPRSWRMTRRTALAATCAGLASMWCGKEIFGRRERGLQTGRWRSLFPANDDQLFSLSKSATARLEPASGSVQLAADNSTLLPLGNPITGKFLFETTLAIETEDRPAGVFFRYRRDKQMIGTLHPFQAILVHYDSSGDLRIAWRDHRWLIARGKSNLEELPWGTAKVNGSHGNSPIVLAVALGASPVPLVRINGIEIPESSWILSREGQQARQMTHDRLETEYLGRIGLYTAGSHTRFSRMRFKYLI
jgi:serine/threonine protein kinase